MTSDSSCQTKIKKLLGGCIKCGEPAGKHQWTKRKGMCPDCWVEYSSHESVGLIYDSSHTTVKEDEIEKSKRLEWDDNEYKG